MLGVNPLCCMSFPQCYTAESQDQSHCTFSWGFITVGLAVETGISQIKHILTAGISKGRVVICAGFGNPVSLNNATGSAWTKLTSSNKVIRFPRFAWTSAWLNCLITLLKIFESQDGMIAPHCSGGTNGLGLPNLTYAAMHALYSSPATGHISAVLRALLDRLGSPLTPDLQLTWPAKPSSSSLSLGLKSSLKAAELCLSKASSLCSLSDN